MAVRANYGLLEIRTGRLTYQFRSAALAVSMCSLPLLMTTPSGLESVSWHHRGTGGFGPISLPKRAYILSDQPQTEVY
jgi:hypothetical protein